MLREFIARMSNSKIDNPPLKNFSCPELDTAVLQCRFAKEMRLTITMKESVDSILKLPNWNRNFVLKKKQFCQLWLLNSGVFGHHAIVASDGINRDMIIDYASPLGSKIANLIPSRAVNVMSSITGALAGLSLSPFVSPIVTTPIVNESIVYVVESRQPAELIIKEFVGDKSQLQRIGTVEVTIDQLEDDAKELFKHNPLYVQLILTAEPFVKCSYKKDYYIHTKVI